MHREAVSFVAACLLLVGVMFMAGNKEFGIAVFIMGLGLLALEVLYVKATGQTISQRFWGWEQTAKLWQKLLIVIGILSFSVYLVGHLFYQW